MSGGVAGEAGRPAPLCRFGPHDFPGKAKGFVSVFAGFGAAALAAYFGGSFV